MCVCRPSFDWHQRVKEIDQECSTKAFEKKKLPHRDLNLDRLDQNQLCYHYTMGQCIRFFLFLMIDRLLSIVFLIAACLLILRIFDSISFRLDPIVCSNRQSRHSHTRHKVEHAAAARALDVHKDIQLGARSTRLRRLTSVYKHMPNHSRRPIDTPQLNISVRHVRLRLGTQV